jgi:integrase
MNQALIVKKPDRVKGIRPWCTHCQREIGNQKCGETGKRITSCQFTESHTLKAIVPVPGAGRSVKTRILNTRDMKQALVLKLEFEEELKSQDYQTTTNHLTQEEVKPMLLIECMALYVAYLNNVNVEAHMVKLRTDKHIWEVEDFFGKFCKAMKANSISHTILRVDQINDRLVGYFHTFILERLQHAPKTYNKMMALFRQFLDWLINQKKYEISNPFRFVQRRIENRDKTIVSREEFQALLDAITPENSYHVLPSGEKKNRFKPWLKQCFQLALETGLRREEFMCLQFSDIVFGDNSEPLFLKVENYKVNRIKGGSDISKDVKSIPITKGLMLLLKELGLEQHIGTDRFLIGQEETASRNTLIELVSRSFTFYWQRTGIKKDVQLKHLRKTYLTALVEHFGDKAPMISDHSGIQVLKDHYVNDQRLVAACKDFSIF